MHVNLMRTQGVDMTNNKRLKKSGFSPKRQKRIFFVNPLEKEIVIDKLTCCNCGKEKPRYKNHYGDCFCSRKCQKEIEGK